MYFKNEAHKDRFHRLIAQAGQENNREYTAALYTIAALGKRVDKYIGKGGGICFPDLFEDAEVWSSSERALLKLAGVLFGASMYSVAVDDVFWHLDEHNCQVALQALEIRYLRR